MAERMFKRMKTKVVFLLWMVVSGVCFPRMYVSLKSGLCKPQSCDSISYKKDVQFCAELGVLLHDEWRISANLDYVAYDRASIDILRDHILTLPDCHAVKICFLSFNLCKDIELSKELSAYIGFGCGVVYTRVCACVDPTFYSASLYTFAGSFQCGVSYKMDENWTLVGGYKVIKVANSSFTKMVGVSESYVNMPLLHCFEVGLRYTF